MEIGLQPKRWGHKISFYLNDIQKLRNDIWGDDGMKERLTEAIMENRHKLVEKTLQPAFSRIDADLHELSKQVTDIRDRVIRLERNGEEK